MAKQISTLKPDYKKIYTDIINQKYPEKIEICKPILAKKQLFVLDIMELNTKIFGTQSKKNDYNKVHRSYDKAAILKILAHQKKKKMNNVATAKHFNISRNTLTKWKKLYLV